MRVSLWKPRSPAEKFQHVVEAKKQKTQDWMHWRWKRRFHFVCVTAPAPKVIKLGAKRDLLGPLFLPQGKVRVCEHSASLAVQIPQKDPFPSHSSRLLKRPKWLGGREQLGEQQSVSWRAKKDTDPISHFVDSIRKPAKEPLGILHLQIPPASLWAPPMLCMPHLHTHTPPPPGLAPCAHPWWQ